MLCGAGSVLVLNKQDKVEWKETPKHKKHKANITRKPLPINHFYVFYVFYV